MNFVAILVHLTFLCPFPSLSSPATCSLSPLTDSLSLSLSHSLPPSPMMCPVAVSLHVPAKLACQAVIYRYVDPSSEDTPTSLSPPPVPQPPVPQPPPVRTSSDHASSAMEQINRLLGLGRLVKTPSPKVLGSNPAVPTAYL